MGSSHTHFHMPSLPEPQWAISNSEKVTQVITMLTQVLANQEKIMATLANILAAVTAETTQIAGLKTLISGLQSQLAAALAGETISPATQAQIDAIFADTQTNAAALTDALNTGAPPVTPPTPTSTPTSTPAPPATPTTP